MKIIKCEACGALIDCQGFTTTCQCGIDYNWAGQRLASREEWGEETGETYADLNINMDRALDKDR